MKAICNLTGPFRLGMSWHLLRAVQRIYLDASEAGELPHGDMPTGNEMIMVATPKGEGTSRDVLGFVTFRETSQKRTIIDLIWIRADWRRQGMGRRMIHLLGVNQWPQTDIEIEVPSDNVIANAFVGASGMKPVSTVFVAGAGNLKK